MPQLLDVGLALCREEALADPLVHLETLGETVPVRTAVEETELEVAALAVTDALLTAVTEFDPVRVGVTLLDLDDDGERESRALRDALADTRADGESRRDALSDPELLVQRVAKGDTELLVDKDGAAENVTITDGDREIVDVTVPETEGLNVLAVLGELLEVVLGHWLTDVEDVTETDTDDDAVELTVLLPHEEIDGVRDALEVADAQPLEVGDEDTDKLVVLEECGDHDEDRVGIEGCAVPLKQTENVGDAVSVNETNPEGESIFDIDGAVENDEELDVDVDGDSVGLGLALRVSLKLPVDERVPDTLSEARGVGDALPLDDVDDVSDILGDGVREDNPDFVNDEDIVVENEGAPDIENDADVVTDGVLQFDGEYTEDTLPEKERCPDDDAFELKERSPLVDCLDDTLTEDDTDGLAVPVRDEDTERELCQDCVARAESENFSDIEAAAVVETVVEGVANTERDAFTEGEFVTVDESSAVADAENEVAIEPVPLIVVFTDKVNKALALERTVTLAVEIVLIEVRGEAEEQKLEETDSTDEIDALTLEVELPVLVGDTVPDALKPGENEVRGLALADVDVTALALKLLEGETECETIVDTDAVGQLDADTGVGLTDIAPDIEANNVPVTDAEEMTVTVGVVFVDAEYEFVPLGLEVGTELTEALEDEEEQTETENTPVPLALEAPDAVTRALYDELTDEDTQLELVEVATTEFVSVLDPVVVAVAEDDAVADAVADSDRVADDDAVAEEVAVLVAVRSDDADTDTVDVPI